MNETLRGEYDTSSFSFVQGGNVLHVAAKEWTLGDNTRESSLTPTVHHSLMLRSLGVIIITAVSSSSESLIPWPIVVHIHLPAHGANLLSHIFPLYKTIEYTVGCSSIVGRIRFFSIALLKANFCFGPTTLKVMKMFWNKKRKHEKSRSQTLISAFLRSNVFRSHNVRGFGFIIRGLCWCILITGCFPCYRCGIQLLGFCWPAVGPTSLRLGYAPGICQHLLGFGLT